jgi:hypothetical protein
MDFVKYYSFIKAKILAITIMHVQLSFMNKINLSCMGNLNDRNLRLSLISHHYPKKMNASMFESKPLGEKCPCRAIRLSEHHH